MKSKLTVLVAAALFSVVGVSLGQAQSASGSSGESEILGNADNYVSLIATDKMDMDMFGRLQMVGNVENVPDSVRDHNRIYLFVKETRLGFRGDVAGYKYETQMAYGGEEQTTSNSPTLTLMDAVVDVPIPVDGTSVKVGQFRVPFGREGLTDTGYMPFAYRSIASLGFNTESTRGNRDVGVALQTYRGKFAGTIGTFTGGGEDINTDPSHNLGQRLGIPEVVARVGYNDGVDEDIYHVVQTDLNVKRDEKAAYIDGLFTKDSSMGHSTVLNISNEKFLLSDSVWNPYINMGGTPNAKQDGDLYMAGADAVIRHLLDNGDVASAEAEVDWGGYSNGFGRVHMSGWRAQASYLMKPWEASLRYAGLEPDKVMPSGREIINEITPSLTWYIHGENFKLVGAVPVYFNMPVTTDPAVGSYVFADLPDQIPGQTGAGSFMKRATVTEAQLMLQFLF